MSDQPPGRPGDPESPDYGWLYGKKSRPDAAGSGDPEPTQVLPAASRRGGGSDYPGRTDTQRVRRQDPAPPSPGGPSPGGPSRGAPPPGGPIIPRRKGGSGAPAARPRRRRPIGKIVLMLVALWVVFMIAVPFWALSKVEKVNATPSGARPGAQPGTTYLLVGSDSRKGLTKAEQKKLGVGGVGDVGQRTDTILLLHTGSGPNVLISIPRDSLVPIPGYGTTKINAAFSYGGPRLLVKTIEQDTGVRIDHYVEVGFGGFVNAVDAVGGVTICPHHNLNDRRSNLHIKKGCQNVNGATALAFSRDRHSFKALGDVQRAANQRKVVAAVGHKVKSPWTFLNPFRYVALNQAAVSSLKVGTGTGPVAMMKFAMAMASGGKNCTMPISDLAVHWDHTRALALMKLIKEDRTSDITKSLCTSSGLAP